MMTTATNLGFPRMGTQRELKKALERFWSNRSSGDELETVARGLGADHWKLQRAVALLARGLAEGRASIAYALAENAAAVQGRRESPRIRSAEVRRRLAAITPERLARAHPS